MDNEPEDIPEIDIEQNPLGWRLQEKLRLLEEHYDELVLLEMSREAIRQVRIATPIYQKIQAYASEDHYVNLHELDDLERAHADIKNDTAGKFSYEDLVDHLVDAKALMVRLTHALERLDDNVNAQMQPAKAGAGCAVVLVATGCSAAALTVLLTIT